MVFKIKFSKKAHLRLRYHRFHTHTDAENKKHAFSFFHEELRSLYGYGIARVGWLDAPGGGIHANPCSKICKAGLLLNSLLKNVHFSVCTVISRWKNLSCSISVSQSLIRLHENMSYISPTLHGLTERERGTYWGRSYCSGESRQSSTLRNK